MRYYIAKLLFAISSWSKCAGKFLLNKDGFLVVDALTIPGWFIVDECLIRQSKLGDKKLKGFTWRYWSMPKEWSLDMFELSKRAK